MMKIRKMIGLFCLFVCFNATAQEVPKEANAIVISTDMPYEDAYDYITKDLLVKGYSLNEASPEGGRIETLPFLVRWGFIDADMMEVSFRYQLKRLEEETQVIIMGRVDLDKEGVAYPSMPICNNGEEKSAMRTAWQMMEELAQRLPGQRLTYRTSPDL